MRAKSPNSKDLKRLLINTDLIRKVKRQVLLIGEKPRQFMRFVAKVVEEVMDNDRS